MSEHWHVLGAGAIGCLFATALRQQQLAVTLISREQPTSASANVILERGNTTVKQSLPLSAAADQQPIQRLLVTTKAYDVSAAVASVTHRLQPQSAILVMVNGMGWLPELQAAHQDLRFYSGTTTEGAWRLAPWHVRHAGAGQTLLGRAGESKAPTWFSAWQAAVANSHWELQIEPALWRKLAINCVINPLTALHGCHNGELSRDRKLLAQTAAVTAEVARVAAAAGFGELAGQLPRLVATVIEDTAENRSSMLQDLEAGSTTEIDYITGYLLHEAERLGIPAPLNRQLLQRVKAAS